MKIMVDLEKLQNFQMVFMHILQPKIFHTLLEIPTDLIHYQKIQYSINHLILIYSFKKKKRKQEIQMKKKKKKVFFCKL